MHPIPQLLSLALTFAIQTAPSQAIAKVCFTRGEYIYLKDLKTGLERRVAKGSYPSLSPDGNVIAYSWDSPSAGDLGREIRLFDLQSGKTITFDSLKKFLSYNAVWAPDGRTIAFNVFIDSQWQVGVMEVDTREWRVLTDKLAKSVGASLNSWTADGKSILCQDLDNIYQVDLGGRVVKKIPTADVIDDISYISSATVFTLSPDGRYLLFDTDQLPGERRPPMIWIYDLQTRTRKRISPGTLGALSPRWLPSGDELVFTGVSLTRGRKSNPGVYRMRKDGTQMQLLVSNAELGSVAVER